MKDAKKRAQEKEAGFFKKNYSLSWKYIKESLVNILLVAFLLFLGFFVALVFQPSFLINPIKAFMETILVDTADFNVFEMTVYIFNNNLKNSFFAMFFGIIFGIAPIFTALVNGYVLGFVAEKSVLVAGPLVLLRLLPHGIFEFPAIILALATGIRLSGYQFAVKEKWRAFLAFVISFFIFLFLLTVLFVLIAAVASPLFLLTDSENFLSPGSYFTSALQLILLISALVSYIISNFIGNLLFVPEDRKLVKREFTRRLEGSLRVFLFVVLPLLIVAAIIEGILIFMLK